MSNNNKPILFGIVSFREKYWKCKSFLSLIKSYKISQFDNNLNIAIYDNTDYEIWDVACDLELGSNIYIHYFRDQSNSGISAAFNHFSMVANINNFEWVVFLDQDTYLPKDFYRSYFERSLNSRNNIVLPIVRSNKKILSPTKYSFYRTSKLNDIPSEVLLKNITAINSGIMIRNDFFIANSGYEKKLRIDFCDHEFIERLNNREIFADIIKVYLEQEFSSEINDKSKAIERYRLFLKDMKQYRKNKNKIIFLFRVDLPHLLKKMYRYRSLTFLIIRFNG
ncbi:MULTISPECIES: glycosyltransferase [Chryseobacterium]|uniref:Rhamnosyltransferase n=1 Tax=Chryseobacterium taihuense TaxID=1141221 RepID=A0A4U8WA48_9FLAO|nr:MULTISPECIES: glycosyltransferase [Chryseobacterium]QQV03726.1 glycosyltransferase [Chryseobacterium sp. FDAARGOS 1104]VFB02933.1 rhamnosyltransferase [Chryseobacterium taihuense]